jgi:hypothetical protein
MSSTRTNTCVTAALILWVLGSFILPGDARVFHQGRFWKDGMLPPPVASFKEKLPEAKWVTQRLDNFNPADTRSWKQVRRYFVKFF